jgi:hypothetical protein
VPADSLIELSHRDDLVRRGADHDCRPLAQVVVVIRTQAGPAADDVLGDGHRSGRGDGPVGVDQVGDDGHEDGDDDVLGPRKRSILGDIGRYSPMTDGRNPE